MHGVMGAKCFDNTKMQGCMHVLICGAKCHPIDTKVHVCVYVWWLIAWKFATSQKAGCLARKPDVNWNANKHLLHQLPINLEDGLQLES